jgi:hypothetical protein
MMTDTKQEWMEKGTLYRSDIVQRTMFLEAILLLLDFLDFAIA